MCTVRTSINPSFYQLDFQNNNMDNLSFDYDVNNEENKGLDVDMNESMDSNDDDTFFLYYLAQFTYCLVQHRTPWWRFASNAPRR